MILPGSSISLGELTPRSLSGYGKVEETAALGIIKACRHLARLIDHVSSYLRQQGGGEHGNRQALADEVSVRMNWMMVLRADQAQVNIASMTI
jgi:hypothetical protein